MQEAYRLLADLGDELGRRFSSEGLDDRKTSPLNTRNQSILAHGFSPIGSKVYECLLAAVGRLEDILIEDAPDAWTPPAPLSAPAQRGISAPRR